MYNKRKTIPKKLLTFENLKAATDEIDKKKGYKKMNYNNEAYINPKELLDLVKQAEYTIKEAKKLEPEKMFSIRQGKKITNRNYFKENVQFNSSLNSKRLNEIKGLYVFIEKGKYAYFGISKTIIRRLKYHFYGDTHNTSSFAYIIATDLYKEKHGYSYQGKRDDFPFHEYNQRIRNRLYKMKIQILPIEDNNVLAMTEIYLSVVYKSKYNSFSTH